MANPGDFLGFWENALANLLGQRPEQKPAPEPYIPDVPPADYISPAANYGYYNSETPLPKDYSVYETPPQYEEPPVPEVTPQEEQPQERPKPVWADYLNRILAPFNVPVAETPPLDVTVPVPVPEGNVDKLPNVTEIPDQYRDAYLWMADVSPDKPTVIPDEYRDKIDWLIKQYPAIQKAAQITPQEPDIPQVTENNQPVQQVVQSNPNWWENLDLGDFLRRTIGFGGQPEKRPAPAIEVKQPDWGKELLTGIGQEASQVGQAISWLTQPYEPGTGLLGIEPSPFAEPALRVSNLGRQLLGKPSYQEELAQWKAGQQAAKETALTQQLSQEAGQPVQLTEEQKLTLQPLPGEGTVARAIYDWGKKVEQENWTGDYDSTNKTVPEMATDPEFWAKGVVRNAPTTVTFMGIALLAATAGRGIAARAGLEGVSNYVVSSLGPAVISRIGESVLEAAQTREQSLQEGKSTQEANQAANTTFGLNMLLTPLDAWQTKYVLSAGLKAMPKEVAEKALEDVAIRAGERGVIDMATARAGDLAKASMRFLTATTSQGAEEVYQNIVQSVAQKQPFDPEANKQSFLAGFLTALVAGGPTGLKETTEAVTGKPTNIQEILRSLPAPGLTIQSVNPEDGFKAEVVKRVDAQLGNNLFASYTPKSIDDLVTELRTSPTVKDTAIASDPQLTEKVYNYALSEAAGIDPIIEEPLNIRTMPDDEYIRNMARFTGRVDPQTGEPLAIDRTEAQGWLRQRDNVIAGKGQVSAPPTPVTILLPEVAPLSEEVPVSTIPFDKNTDKFNIKYMPTTTGKELGVQYHFLENGKPTLEAADTITDELDIPGIAQEHVVVYKPDMELKWQDTGLTVAQFAAPIPTVAPPETVAAPMPEAQAPAIDLNQRLRGIFEQSNLASTQIDAIMADPEVQAVIMGPGPTSPEDAMANIQNLFTVLKKIAPDVKASLVGIAYDDLTAAKEGKSNPVWDLTNPELKKLNITVRDTARPGSSLRTSMNLAFEKPAATPVEEPITAAPTEPVAAEPTVEPIVEPPAITPVIEEVTPSEPVVQPAATGAEVPPTVPPVPPTTAAPMPEPEPSPISNDLQSMRAEPYVQNANFVTALSSKLASGVFPKLNPTDKSYKVDNILRGPDTTKAKQVWDDLNPKQKASFFTAFTATVEKLRSEDENKARDEWGYEEAPRINKEVKNLNVDPSRMVEAATEWPSTFISDFNLRGKEPSPANLTDDDVYNYIMRFMSDYIEVPARGKFIQAILNHQIPTWSNAYAKGMKKQVNVVDVAGNKIIIPLTGEDYAKFEGYVKSKKSAQAAGNDFMQRFLANQIQPLRDRAQEIIDEFRTGLDAKQADARSVVIPVLTRLGNIIPREEKLLHNGRTEVVYSPVPADRINAIADMIKATSNPSLEGVSDEQLRADVGAVINGILPIIDVDKSTVDYGPAATNIDNFTGLQKVIYTVIKDSDLKDPSWSPTPLGGVPEGLPTRARWTMGPVVPLVDASAMPQQEQANYNYRLNNRKSLLHTVLHNLDRSIGKEDIYADDSATRITLESNSQVMTKGQKSAALANIVLAAGQGDINGTEAFNALGALAEDGLTVGDYTYILHHTLSRGRLESQDFYYWQPKPGETEPPGFVPIDKTYTRTVNEDISAQARMGLTGLSNRLEWLKGLAKVLGIRIDPDRQTIYDVMKYLAEKGVVEKPAKYLDTGDAIAIQGYIRGEGRGKIDDRYEAILDNILGVGSALTPYDYMRVASRLLLPDLVNVTTNIPVDYGLLNTERRLAGWASLLKDENPGFWNKVKKQWTEFSEKIITDVIHNEKAEPRNVNDEDRGSFWIRLYRQYSAAANAALVHLYETVSRKYNITDKNLIKYLSAYMAEQSDWEKYSKSFDAKTLAAFKRARQEHVKLQKSAIQASTDLLASAGIKRPEINNAADIDKYLAELKPEIRDVVQKQLRAQQLLLNKGLQVPSVRPLARPFGVDMSTEAHIITLAKIRQEAGDDVYARIVGASEDIYKYLKGRLKDLRNGQLIDDGLFKELYDNWHFWTPDSLVDLISEDVLGQRQRAQQVGLDASVIDRLINGTEGRARDPLHSVTIYNGRIWNAILRNQATISTINNLRGSGIPVRQVRLNETLANTDEIATPMYLDGKLTRWAVPAVYARPLFQEPDVDSSFFISIGKITANPLKITATGRNPLFLLKNLIIDYVTATVHGGVTPWEWARSLAKITTDPAYRAKMQAAGISSGTAGYFRSPGSALFDRAATERSIEKGVEEAMGGDWYKIDSMRKLRSVMRRLVTFEWAEQLGAMTELVPRAATYEKWMKGKTIEVPESIAERGGLDYVHVPARGEIRAIIASKNVVMDFHYLGSWVRVMNHMVPYFGVGVQSPLQIIRAFVPRNTASKGGPVMVAARLFGIMILPTIMITLWNKMDRNKDKYAQVPDHVKQRSWVIMLPFNDSNEWKDRSGNPVPPYLEIPLRDWAPFANIVAAGVENGMKLDPYAWRNISLSMFSYWSPVQDSLGFLPPLGQNAAEVWANKNLFTGRALIPAELKALPPREQYTGKESAFSMLLANRLGTSPIVTDHFISSNFGGLGSIVLGAVSGGLLALGLGEKDKAQQKTGDKLYGRFVYPDGTVESDISEADLPYYRSQALMGQGELSVVSAPDVPTAQNRMNRSLYTSQINAHMYAGDILGIGGIISSLGYKERGGGLSARAGMAMDIAGGEGTAEATSATWAQLRASEKYRTNLQREEQLWDALEGKTDKPISGAEFQKQLRTLQTERAEMIETAQALNPMAAISGERARTIREAASTLLGTAQDSRERGQILAESWYAISPKPDENGIDDMKAFFDEQDAFKKSLSEDDRFLLEQYTAPKRPIQADFERARNVIGEIVSLSRYAEETGISKKQGEEIYQAGQKLNMYVDRLDPSVTNKQTVALAQLARDDPNSADLAVKYINLRNSLNPKVKEKRQENAILLQKFYGNTPIGEYADISGVQTGTMPTTAGPTGPVSVPTGFVIPITREGDKQTVTGIINQAPKYTSAVSQGWAEYNTIASGDKLDWQKKHTALYKQMSDQKKAKDTYLAENPIYKDYIRYVKSQVPDVDDADLEGSVSQIDKATGIDSVALFMVNLAARGKTVQGSIGKGKEAAAGAPTQTTAELEKQAQTKLYPNLEKQSSQLESLFNEMPQYSPEVKEAWANYDMMSTQEKTAFRNGNKALYAQMTKEDSARQSFINHNPALKNFLAYVKREYDLTDEDLSDMGHIDDLDLATNLRTASDFILYLKRTNKDVQVMFNRAKPVPETTPTVVTIGGGGYVPRATTTTRKTTTAKATKAPAKTVYQMIVELLARKGRIGAAVTKATIAALPKGKNDKSMSALLMLWNAYRKKQGLSPFKTIQDMIKEMAKASDDERKKWLDLTKLMVESITV